MARSFWRRPLTAFALALTPLLALSCANSDGAPEPATQAPALSRTVVPSIAADSTPGPLSVSLVKVASGFERPTFVTHAGDGSGRLFVVEKVGTIRTIVGGAANQQPFLDITAMVESDGNEQGLLGLAFHPRFETNGRFFVAFTAARTGANTVMEFQVPAPGGLASPAPVRTLFAIADSRSNHNGGMLAFGPDGHLYISTGDGGGGGDPDKNGQKLSALLGKILRVDVDTGEPYAVPADNPFVGREGARPEVWAYGLRNPWRFSFDRQSGDLWIADVGQNAIEEIDLQPAASMGGENYGWNVMEGSRCFQPANGCEQAALVPPVFEYTHAAGGCSVTGGYVYRGTAIPSLLGRYVFTDYCDEALRTLRREGNRWLAETIGTTAGAVSAFGEDEAGELYVVGDQDGTIYRLGR